MQRLDGRLGILHHDALGDLELELVWVEPGLPQRAFDVGQQVRLLELASRQIHAHHHGLLVKGEHLPALRPAARLLQHPLADRHDEAGLFGDGDEHQWRHDPVARPLPAGERLELVDGARFQVDHGLEIHPQLVAVQRMPQVRLDLQPLDRARLHAGVEHRVAGAPVRLGAVQRQIRVAQHGFRSIRERAAERDADAGAHKHFAPVEHHWQAQRLGDPLGDFLCLAFVDDVLDEHGELVATKSCGGVTGPQAQVDPVGHFDQQRVSKRVAQAVIHHFEAVQIEKQHRHLTLLTSRAFERVRQPVEQQRSIG